MRKTGVFILAKSGNNTFTLTIVTISLLLIGGLLWWFLNNFEQYQHEDYVGYSGKAARDPFYAAEIFLKKYGTEVTSVNTIQELNKMPDTQDILLIPTKRYDIGKQRLDDIMQWVKSGGHLIALARYGSKKEKGPRDLLFEQLGVTSQRDYENDEFFATFLQNLKQSQEENQEKPAGSEKPVNKKKSAQPLEAPDSHREPLIVKGNDDVEDKKVLFAQSRWMDFENRDELLWIVKGKQGAQLLEYRIGRGRVTLLSDIYFMLNKSIGKFDHASFLYYLVHVDDKPHKIWLIKYGDSPSLFALIFEKSSLVIYTLLAFVLIWLWYASRRFGPIVSGTSTIRRSMREHIESTGHYQWRHHNRGELLASVHKALHDELVHSRPLWAKLPPEELAEKLAKLAKLDKQRVYKAITTRTVERELDFTALLETLSILRKTL